MTVSGGDRITVGGTTVRGVAVDDATRCTHYDSRRDVLAFAFPCCGTFYPCVHCHAALADHDAEVWPTTAFDERAVCCGACGERLAIETYLASPLACPGCDAEFNPGCVDHHDRYFDV